MDNRQRVLRESWNLMKGTLDPDLDKGFLEKPVPKAVLRNE